MSIYYEDYFIDRLGKLEVFIKLEGDYCLLLMGGRAETQQAREVHALLLVTGIISNEKKYNFIVDLSKVRYLSSTALGMISQLAQIKKDKFVICGADSACRKGLSSVGVSTGDDVESVLFEENISAVLDEYAFPRELKERVLSAIDKLQEPHQPDLREAAIVASYLKETDDKAVAAAMSKMERFMKEAFNSERLLIPAKNEFSVCTFIYLRRLLRSIDRYSKEPTQYYYDEDTVEILAKELTENAVRWAYPSREGIIELNYSLNAKYLVVFFCDYGVGYREKKLRGIFRAGGKGLKRIRNVIDGYLTVISPAPVISKKTRNEITAEFSSMVPGKGTFIIMMIPRLPRVPRQKK
jgi:anti-anti-sigma regulatory factor